MERMAGLLIVQVLIVIGGLSLAAPTCREGFHLIDEPRGFCCRPIKCPKDYQYHLCNEDNGSDTCTPCKEGTINPNVIDTSKFPYPLDDLCFQPECTCAPEAKLINPKKCRKTGKAECVCNLQNFFHGNDSLNCHKVNLTIQRSASRAGFQLTQQGNVAECPPGYFKSENDSSTCRPHTGCPKGSSVDVPGTRFHDTRCKIDNGTKNTSPIPPDQSPTSTPADPDISTLDVAVYIGVVIIIICVIILLICCCVKHQWYNKLKCYARKENAPSTIIVENEQEQELLEISGDGNVTDKHGEEEMVDRHGEEEAVDRHGEDEAMDRHGEEEAMDRHGEEEAMDRQSPAMLLPTELTSSDSGEKFSDLPGSVGRTMDFDSLSGKDSGVASLQHNIPQKIVKDISEPKFKTDLAASEAPVENRSDIKDLPEVVGESLNFSSVLSEKDSQADDSETDSDMTSRVSTMTSSDPWGNGGVSFISEVSVDQGLGDSRKSGKKPTQIVRPVQLDKNSNDKGVSGNYDQDETKSKEYF